MAPVPVEIQKPSRSVEQIEFVSDMDEVIESTKCSCNADDDNPY